MTCWYLFNSGFAVHTGRHFLVFDYFLELPKYGSLSAGVINPEELAAMDVPITVFASHSHYDHFHERILRWREQIPGIRYVLADEICADVDACWLHPGDTCELDGLRVRALESTDLGVAFVVEVDGYRIYHAGDLNWWHWEGEPDAGNQEMAQRYQQQINLLRGEQIDLAFVPVDPRLGEAYALGLTYFMETVGASQVVPMHFRTDFTIFSRLLVDPVTEPFRDRLVCLSRRGERFEPLSKPIEAASHEEELNDGTQHACGST